MKRLLYLATLSVLALLVLAPAALAQSDSLDSQGVTQPCPVQLDQFPAGTVCGEGGAYIDPEDQTAAEPVAENVAEGINPVLDPGDNVDPNTGQVAGDDTPDCERPEDVLESGLCRTSEAAPPGTTPTGGAEGTVTCEDFEDQGQAQEALGRGLRGDPAYDPEVLDEDGDGMACEELPTATDPNAPASGTKTGETTNAEGTGGEGSDGAAGETTAQGGGTLGTGGEEGGSGGGADGSAKGDDSPQGGLALAVSDGLGSPSRGRLPNTGGGWAVLLLTGAALIGGGLLLVRRFSSSG